MTRKEFKDLAMEVIKNDYAMDGWKTFDSDDINRYKIAQYDEDDWDVESSMPFEEFLDELYEVIKCEEDER